MAEVSILTVALSAGASVITGYFGTLINFSRQRQRQRRTYGLSLLAEIKAIQGLARHYYGEFGGGNADLSTYHLPRPRFSSADMTVFNNVSANVGLFSTRAAVQIIAFYSIVRNLTAQAQVLAELQERPDAEQDFRDQLADHLKHLRRARHQGVLTTRALRKETPTDFDQKLRICRRRLLLRVRRFSWRRT